MTSTSRAVGLVELGVGERVGMGVGLRVGHARIAVAEQHDLVVADDLGGGPQLLEAHVVEVARGPRGVSMAGLRMSPSSPPVQHTSTARTPAAL